MWLNVFFLIYKICIPEILPYSFKKECLVNMLATAEASRKPGLPKELGDLDHPIVSSTHFVLWQGKEFSAAQFPRDVLPSLMKKSISIWGETHDGTQSIQSWRLPLNQCPVGAFSHLPTAPSRNWHLPLTSLRSEFSSSMTFFNFLLLFSTRDREFAESYNLDRKRHGHGRHLPIITADPSRQITRHGHCWGKRGIMGKTKKRNDIMLLFFFDPSNLWLKS